MSKPEAPNSTASIPVPPDSSPKVAEARAHLVDDVAGTDDALTEKYLNEGDLSQEELDDGARHAVTDCKLIPVYEASCTMPSGHRRAARRRGRPAARATGGGPRSQGEANGDVRERGAAGPARGARLQDAHRSARRQAELRARSLGHAQAGRPGLRRRQRPARADRRAVAGHVEGDQAHRRGRRRRDLSPWRSSRPRRPATR